MDFFVGTSGWYYPWNEKRSLDWFVAEFGLNAVELNASFYRFPFSNMVKSWARKGIGLGWAVKVNRFITHFFKFSDKAFNTWQKFRNLFVPLDANADFYLFQLPPRTTPESVAPIENFVEKTGLQRRFAFEVRNIKWFDETWVSWASKLGITWVSVDSPDFPLQRIQHERLSLRKNTRKNRMVRSLLQRRRTRRSCRENRKSKTRKDLCFLQQ